MNTVSKRFEAFDLLFRIFQLKKRKAPNADLYQSCIYWFLEILFHKVVSHLIHCFVSFNWERKDPDADLLPVMINSLLGMGFHKVVSFLVFCFVFSIEKGKGLMYQSCIYRLSGIRFHKVVSHLISCFVLVNRERKGVRQISNSLVFIGFSGIRVYKVVNHLISCFLYFNWERKGHDVDLYQSCIYWILGIGFHKVVTLRSHVSFLSINKVKVIL